MKRKIHPNLPIIILYGILLIVFVFGFYVPLMPIMPARVDGERYAANEALALGMQFGRDFIFTSGPYASVYTKLYHPFADLFMILGGSLIAISTWFSSVILSKNTGFFEFLFFVFFLFLLPAPGDSFLLFAPLLIALACIKFNNFSLENIFLRRLTLILMLIPLGLLPLVKGTMLILSVFSTAVIIINFLVKKEYILVIVSVFTPIFSALIFWIAAKQNIANIPAYFNSIIDISSPYSESMSLNFGGPLDMPIYFLLAVGTMTLIIFNRNIFSKVDQFSLFFILLLYIFIAFKAGFVRHDLGHVRISFGCILFGIACLPLLIPGRRVLGGSVLLSVIGCIWMYTYGMYFQNGLGYLYEVKNNYITQLDGLMHRVKNDNFIKNEFDRSNQSLRDEYSIPYLAGTADIYSYNQPYLIASSNIWSSRPIMHSYSSYSKILLRKNNEHLLGKNAPNNLIFAIQVMDNRFPALDDGLSWFTFLKNYSPERKDGEYLYLTRNDQAVKWQLQEISEENYKFGEEINAPSFQNGILAARISFTKSLLGKISNFLYKPSQLRIILNFYDGSKREFRLISTMTETEFVLSPLIENIDDFESLFKLNLGVDNPKKVQSFSIESNDVRFKDWNDVFKLTFLTFSKI